MIMERFNPANLLDQLGYYQPILPIVGGDLSHIQPLPQSLLIVLAGQDHLISHKFSTGDHKRLISPSLNDHNSFAAYH